MQRIHLKNAMFAALGVALCAAAPAQVTSTASVTPQLSTAVSYDDYARFYSASKNAPIWFRAGQEQTGPVLVEILKRSTIEGFVRGPQLAADVEAALARAQSGDPAAQLEADKVLSRAWVAYVQAIHAPTPGMIYSEKWVTPAVPSTFAILGKALRAPSLVEHLKTVSDVNPIYAALREAATKEAALPGGGNSARYAANLERARAIPAKGKFVLVDAATARLWMYQDGRPVDSMKVVVGDKDKLGLPTPMVASVIWYTTFNPYWHVPPHLVRKIAEKHAANIQSYLKANGYEVVSDWNATEIIPASSVDWKGVASGTVNVKVRQLPGGTNSMGKMKFNFANPEGIYLHDTPTRAYFNLKNRHLSNGCIRVEDAARLARFLFGSDQLPAASAPEQHVQLPQGVPVYVTYLTARPDLSELALVRDVYGWDVPGASGRFAATAQAAGSGR
ncbi:MAG TPA: L,D-transpeptidase family protein [Sphingomicrobium sp.]|nr:L,D-transpeptidase family protein [Sphingomicrobium sp.]